MVTFKVNYETKLSKHLFQGPVIGFAVSGEQKVNENEHRVGIDLYRKGTDVGKFASVKVMLDDYQSDPKGKKYNPAKGQFHPLKKTQYTL